MTYANQALSAQPKTEGDVHPAFVHASRTPVETAGDGIKRQLMGYGPKIMGAHVWFQVGAIGQMHAHHHAQMAYVVSGVFDVTVGEETRTLKAGDSFYVAPNVMHGAVCLEAGELLDVFSPWREDFLPEGVAARAENT